MTKKRTAVPSPPDAGIRQAEKRPSPADMMSPAAGVRALRRMLESRSGSEGEQRALTGVVTRLAGLEAGYREVFTGTSSNDAVQPSRVPLRNATPPVIAAALTLAAITAKDEVVDLGCGDGRVVLAAARRGARGVGIDGDPQAIKKARARAVQRGLSRRVRFAVGDMFKADVRGASAVMLSSSPPANPARLSRLLKQLAPGTRIVSAAFAVAELPPARAVEVDGVRVSCWVVPSRQVKGGRGSVG